METTVQALPIEPDGVRITFRKPGVYVVRYHYSSGTIQTDTVSIDAGKEGDEAWCSPGIDVLKIEVLRI